MGSRLLASLRKGWVCTMEKGGYKDGNLVLEEEATRVLKYHTCSV